MWRPSELNLPVTRVAMAALLGALAARSSPGQGNGGAAAPATASSTTGRFEADRLTSKALGREVAYGIHLPPGYDSEPMRKYPVVFWLHGMLEDHARFNHRGGSEVVAQLYAKKQLPPVLIAIVDGGRTSFYCNGVSSGAYEDLIVKDFIPFIESKYRALGTRAGRSIAGTSMGGNGALKIAFRHPDMFCAVATHSAALFPVDLEQLPARFKRTLESQFGEHFKAIWGDPVDKVRWAEDNPLALAEKATPESFKGLVIAMDCGDRDRYSFQVPGAQLHEILDRKKVQNQWAVLPGGHGWGDYLVLYLDRSLRFLTTAMTAGKAAAASQPASRKG
jgi:S-formylglutathione hydrolase FrmB